MALFGGDVVLYEHLSVTVAIVVMVCGCGR